MLFVVVITTLRSHPYFGNMDDGLLLELASAKDPVQFAHDYGWRPSAGFLNDFSMILVWPSYWIGAVVGPTCFYLANSVTVFACILAFGLAAGRIAGWRGPWPILAFLAGALLWPYTAELFFFPSLQEKGIILGAALMFWWVAEAPRLTSPIAYWISLAAVSLFAFATKTQILVFVPGFLYALWAYRSTARGHISALRAIVVTGYLILLSAVLLILALGGSYNKGTQGSLDLSFLGDRRFQFLVALTVLYVLALVLRVFMRRNQWSDWVPAVMLLSMCGTFVIWDIRNYFLAIAGVMVGSAAATVAGWLRPVWMQATLAVTIVILASAWLLFRLPAVYGSLASVGDFLASPIVKQLDAERATVYVSCMEAPVHYNKYAADIGLNDVNFAYLGDRPSDTDLGQGVGAEYVFGDSRLCPWAPDSSNWQTVWTNGNPQSFQLFARY